jgi:hypothetical protein
MKSSCALIVALERRVGHQILLYPPLKKELKKIQGTQAIKKSTFFK